MNVFRGFKRRVRPGSDTGQTRVRHGSDPCLTLSMVVLLGVLCVAQAGQQPPPADPAPAGGRAGGQGGGRGNAAATLFTATCAPCHGTDLAGGRAPTLFSERLLTSNDDETLAAKIRDGVPNTAMQPFKGTLDDQQIWQLVAYIRTTAANLKDKPVFVPDPNNQTIKSEKQTFRIEVVAPGLETPWGLAFLPDGRLLVTERSGRLRIIEKGKLLPEAVQGTPKVWERQDAGMLDVAIHPQYAKNGWIYLAYTEVVPGYVAPPPPPAAAAPAEPAAAAGARGRGRGGPPSPPSMTVFVRGKIDKTNRWVEEQVIYRAPSDLYTPSGSHYGTRFLFDRTGHLFYSLGERGEMTNAQDLSKPLGKIHRVNDDGSIPKDNPFVNTPNALPSIWSYGHRNPQGLAWDPDRPDVGIRTRADRWRRDQRRRERQELRLGRDLDGIAERDNRAQPRGNGAADRLLHADDRAERHRLLQRLEVSRLEEQPVRRRAGGAATAPPRDQRTKGRPPGSRVPAVRPCPCRDHGARRPPLCTAAEPDGIGHGARPVGVDPGHGHSPRP